MLNTLAAYNISLTRSLNISPTCLSTLYLHACQVRVTLGDASLCCFICVTYFERLLSPLCVSSIKCYGQNRLFWELATPVTEQFVLEILQKTVPKSCDLDPIPTKLLYEILGVLLPTITNIIITSLASGPVPPPDFKGDCQTPVQKILP